MNQSSYNFPVIQLSSPGWPWLALVGWSVRSCSSGPRPPFCPTLREWLVEDLLHRWIRRDEPCAREVTSRTGLPSAVLQSESDEADAGMDLARGACRAGPFDCCPSDCPSRRGFLLRLCCVLFARMSGAFEEGRHARAVPDGPDRHGGFWFGAPSRRRPLPVLRFPARVRGCGGAARFPLRPAARVFATRASPFGASRDERFRLASHRSR